MMSITSVILAASTYSILRIGFIIYVVLELVFYVVFHRYMIGKANERTKPSPYLDPVYAKVQDRHLLTDRLIDRFIDFTKYEYKYHNKDKRTLQSIQRELIRQYVYGMFHKPGVVPDVSPGILSPHPATTLVSRPSFHTSMEYPTLTDLLGTCDDDVDHRNDSTDVDEVEPVDNATVLSRVGSFVLLDSPELISDTATHNQTHIDGTKPFMKNSRSFVTETTDAASISSSSSAPIDIEDNDEDEIDNDSNIDDVDDIVETSGMEDLDFNEESLSTKIVSNLNHIEHVCGGTISTCSTTSHGSAIPTNDFVSDREMNTVRTRINKDLKRSKSSNINPHLWTINDVCIYDMNEFSSETMFCKPYHELSYEEVYEIQLFYNKLKDEFNLVFLNHSEEDEQGGKKDIQFRKPRRLIFENMNTMHRPLIFYMFIKFMYYMACIVLYLFGFKRVQSNRSSLKGWYRPPSMGQTSSSATTTGKEAESRSYVFFHGIAIGGITIYVPLLYGMLLRGNKLTKYDSIFLFEHPNIASMSVWNYDTLSETQVCEGVYEIMERYIGPKEMLKHKITVMGHSFGSCNVTWITKSSLFENMIQAIILLDPVSILLSDPDVMVNFLYRDKFIDLIRLVASSELYTEYYLRRQFAWYNCELWMEHDILKNPKLKHIPVIIALSGNDAIVNSPKVRHHLEILCHDFEQKAFHSGPIKKTINNEINNATLIKDKTCDGHKIQVIYWNHAIHGQCLADPYKWNEIHGKLLLLQKS